MAYPRIQKRCIKKRLIPNVFAMTPRELCSLYNKNGTVNREASRRVEFKFRLKDSEMIQEMNQILSQMQN